MVQVMHHGARGEAAVAADDVHELLGAEVGGEAAFGDDVVGQLHGDLVGDDRVVTLGDVGEGPRVDQAGVAFERLHEVRLDGVLEQHRHGSAGADVVGGEGIAPAVVAERDAAEALAKVLERGGEAEDGHDLAGDRDVVAGLAREAVEAPAEAVDDLAHGAVVQVDAAPPRDGQRVDVEVVAVHDVAVDHGGQQVVGGAHGMDVAGEVEVQVLHRDELRVPAAGGAALDAEDRPQRRLAQGEHGVDADRVHRLGQADRGDGLAFAERRRGDRGDVDDLAVGLALEALEQGHVVDLGLVAAVELQLLFEDPDLRRDLRDGLHGRRLGDVDVRRDGGLADRLCSGTQRALLSRNHFSTRSTLEGRNPRWGHPSCDGFYKAPNWGVKPGSARQPEPGRRRPWPAVRRGPPPGDSPRIPARR